MEMRERSSEVLGSIAPHQGGAGPREGRPARGGPGTAWERGNEAACQLGPDFLRGRSV